MSSFRYPYLTRLIGWSNVCKLLANLELFTVCSLELQLSLSDKEKIAASCQEFADSLFK